MRNAVLLSCICLIAGCSSTEADLSITDADIVQKDGMSQLKVCFNRNFKKGYVSSVQVMTKDGHSFGRSDMIMGFDAAANDSTLCVYETPYFFLRNTKDEALRARYKNSMTPGNIKSIKIQLGSVPVQGSYSEDYPLINYMKEFNK